jgi:hypothetical protein
MLLWSEREAIQEVKAVNLSLCSSSKYNGQEDRESMSSYSTNARALWNHESEHSEESTETGKRGNGKEGGNTNRDESRKKNARICIVIFGGAAV